MEVEREKEAKNVHCTSAVAKAAVIQESIKLYVFPLYGSSKVSM